MQVDKLDETRFKSARDLGCTTNNFDIIYHLVHELLSLERTLDITIICRLGLLFLIRWKRYPTTRCFFDEIKRALLIQRYYIREILLREWLPRTESQKEKFLWIFNHSSATLYPKIKFWYDSDSLKLMYSTICSKRIWKRTGNSRRRPIYNWPVGNIHMANSSKLGTKGLYLPWKCFGHFAKERIRLTPRLLMKHFSYYNTKYAQQISAAMGRGAGFPPDKYATIAHSCLTASKDASMVLIMHPYASIESCTERSANWGWFGEVRGVEEMRRKLILSGK